MQTFLTFPDFKECAKNLDYRRLGKQRVEAYQILNIITGNQVSKGWKNHPAVLMWQGYDVALKLYINEMIYEWINRGYINNMLTYKVDKDIKYPWWLGDQNFHRSHRSRLIQKNPSFYEPLFPNDVNFNQGKYLWPVNETKTFKMI